MILYLRRLRNMAATNARLMEEANREFSIFVQFLVIFIVFFLYYESFWFAEKFIRLCLLPNIVAKILMGTLVILNSSVNPLLYMAFSSNMKEAMRGSLESKNSTVLTRRIKAMTVMSFKPLLRSHTSAARNEEIVEQL